jgi:aminoglycoside phosphotransferase (APT) family kinase protein
MVTTRDAEDAVTALDALPAVTAVEPIAGGSNDSFHIDTTDGRFVAKFNTFSLHETFRAEARILRFLDAHTDLPVPELVAIEAGSTTRPAPFFVTRYIDGAAPTPLTEYYQPHLPRRMGFIVMLLGLFEDDELTGYGRIEPNGPDGVLSADGDSWREYYAGYVRDVLDDAEWTAPEFAREYIDAIRDAFEARVDAVPAHPDSAIILPDFRLDNLLVDDQRVAGVLDFERADIGDPHLTLANTHYLLGRGLHDSTRERLRDDLAEGHVGWMSEEKARVYRLGALAKEVRAFDHWWKDATDDEYERHAERLKTDLDAAI